MKLASIIVNPFVETARGPDGQAGLTSVSLRVELVVLPESGDETGLGGLNEAQFLAHPFPSARYLRDLISFTPELGGSRLGQAVITYGVDNE